ncbi:MAG: glycosyltransferase family 2 protein [Caldilineaceae bacterium]|nr:glycosyltransferase family 2 protein [Caldilineaceae bacterium]
MAKVDSAVFSPDISVVICAYTEDRYADLVAAVRSIRNQYLPPLEIVVVIDHNPALFVRVQHSLEGIVVVENGQQRGLSGARNSGVAAASGAIIAFMDEDAMAAPDWLEQLRGGFEMPHVMGVGGKIEPLWPGARPRWLPEEFDWVVGCTYLGMPVTSVPVRNLIGCNMAVRREVFAEVGGFRQGIGRIGVTPVGCEETELCIRAGQHWPDRVILYEPRALVRHRVSANRTKWRYFRSRCVAEGRSKALVTALVGTADGLATERSYTTRTLPRGVLRGVQEAVTRRNIWGLARAGAIIMGFGLTAAGYVIGRLQRHLLPRTRRTRPDASYARRAEQEL